MITTGPNGFDIICVKKASGFYTVWYKTHSPEIFPLRTLQDTTFNSSVLRTIHYFNIENQHLLWPNPTPYQPLKSVLHSLQIHCSNDFDNNMYQTKVLRFLYSWKAVNLFKRGVWWCWVRISRMTLKKMYFIRFLRNWRNSSINNIPFSL